jgi:hypothetical protein
MKAFVKLFVLLVLLSVAAPVPAQAVPKVGDPVFAQWKKNDWYHGRVAKKSAEGFHITFDDGDKAVVGPRRIALDRVPSKSEVELGTRVVARWNGDGRFYPGKIDEIGTDGRYRIKFEDGDVGHARLKDIRPTLK